MENHSLNREQKKRILAQMPFDHTTITCFERILNMDKVLDLYEQEKN